MSYIKVKNKNGTADKTAPTGYTSWLDFWEKNQGKKASACENRSCTSKAMHGAHVIKAGQGGKEYIIPLCATCNNPNNVDEFNTWEPDLVAVAG